MPDQRNYDRIFVNDLTLEMSAGIYEHEKQVPQRVLINIVMDVQSNEGRILSSISDVTSYEEVVKMCTDLAQKKHYDLLEELAEKMATCLLGMTGALSVKIRIEKPDIIESAKSVGIEICRYKQG